MFHLCPLQGGSLLNYFFYPYAFFHVGVTVHYCQKRSQGAYFHIYKIITTIKPKGSQVLFFTEYHIL